MAQEFRKKQKMANLLRLGVLILILVTLTVFGILHQYPQGWRPVGVDAFCPFGGVESLITVLQTGRFLEKIALSSFILLLATMITALVFRRSFCGYLCPLGTLQELFGRLGKKLLGKRLTLASSVDRYIRFGKYIVFVLVVAFSAILGELVFRPYDPWVAYQHLTSDELFSSLLGGFVVLILSLIGSFFYDRVFCKYLCPLGGFLGILSKVGYFRIRRNETTCINCKVCTKVCPVNLPVAELQVVTSAECISCNLCVNACPVENTLTIVGKRKGRLASISVLAATLGIFLLVVGISTYTGGFAWSVKSIQEITLHTGRFNPDEIKGSDTWKAVSELSGIPKEEFMKTFGLTEKEFFGTLREWAHKPGSTREVSEVREYVKKRLGK
ncbi:MAG: 4Fe-4S binding protein [Spirochaetes bacterium]|nr:4Fe-4S binding protein [Spirochaetota bacterium]